MSKKILVINASPNRNGNTAHFVQTLLAGRDYETLNLVDYHFGGLGQVFAEDDFEEIYQAMVSADVLVFGSPMYWHTFAGPLKVLLDRIYVHEGTDDLAGKNLFFIIQGTAPSPESIASTDFIISRFAQIYGLNYKGKANYLSEIKALQAKL